MTEPTAATGTPPPATTRTRGYFNQAQLEDLDLAETVLTAATAHAAALEEQDITAAYLAGFSQMVAEARQRATQSGHGHEESRQATASAIKAAAELHTALQRVQSAAKQKHKMLAEDGDPATDFPTDGYLIGSRLNGSRAALLQSAETLIARAKTDSLPGFKTPEKTAALDALLAAYRAAEGDQQDTSRTKEISRLTRDELLHTLNTRRSAIQHAADSLWPWSDEALRPIRKTFSLPLNRPLGM
jgi:hypothetical protein